MATIKYKLVKFEPPKKKRGFLSGIFKRSDEPVYDTGGNGRRMRGWIPGITGPNSMIVNGAAEMRNRSRDLTRKFPLMNGAYDTISSNIVGTGVRALPKATNKSDRQIIKEAWDEWCSECDVDGVNDFGLMLDLAVRQRYEAGEVFFRHRPCRVEDGFFIPYQIQMLEAEYVPYEMNMILANGNVILAGVEFNKLGRRVAYHMYKNHPGDNVVYTDSFQTIRVPADEVLHYFKPLRPGQVRGIPECFASQAKARDLMIYDEAELAKKQTASLMAGFIISPAGEGMLNEDADDIDADPGEAISKLEPGSMMTLEPGEDVKFNNPVESGSSYEPFMRNTHRSLASSLNMTYEEFSLDLSGVNFSSIRAGLNQSQRKYRKEQKRLIHMVCLPVWKKFFETAVLAGIFDFVGYEDSPRDFMRVQFQPPGWAYVNPLQEIQAKKEEVKAGFKSRAQVVAESGYDVEEVDELIKQDADRASEMGLHFDIDPTLGKEETIVVEDPDKE